MALRKILKQVGKLFSRKLLFAANIIRINWNYQHKNILD